MKHTNRQLKALAKRFAKAFKLKWLPKGNPNLMDGFPAGSVIDPMRGAEVGILYITKAGRGQSLMAGDGYYGAWRRVRPGSVERAIRERKGCYYRGQWVS